MLVAILIWLGLGLIGTGMTLFHLQVESRHSMFVMNPNEYRKKSYLLALLGPIFVIVLVSLILSEDSGFDIGFKYW